MPDESKPRLVASLSVIDPESHYSCGGRACFRLLLDDTNRLTIKETRSGDSALVSDLDEIVQVVHHCQQRLERKRGLQAKRGNFRELLAQIILASTLSACRRLTRMKPNRP